MAKMEFDFTGKIVLVTGASAGIGAATARLFADHGADVAITARGEDKLRARAGQIEQETGRRCLAISSDATEPDQVEAMVEQVIAEFGRIDILINNVGNSVRSSLRKLTPELWQ